MTKESTRPGCHGSSLVAAIEFAISHPGPSMEAVLNAMPLQRAAGLREWLLDPTTGVVLKDQALLRAIGLASEESDAALLLVYCLLPGLAGLARRFPTFEQEELWSELITLLLAQVRRYDARRRPRRVAANLLLDTLAGVCRWAARESKNSPPPGADPIYQVDPTSAFCPVEEGLRCGVLRATDATLISATRLRGLDLESTAALLGLSYEAAKKRRRRAELALARWWSDADPGASTERAA